MTNQPSPIDHAAWNTWRRENPFTWPDLHDANLSGADLYRANLRGAYLYGADLRGANLVTANLVTANLCGANLCGANLSGANLSGADLRGADLSGANLRGAYLYGADLSGADLRGADLSGAYLYGADLRGAYLYGATLNWSSHDLISEILRRAAGDDVARLMLAGLPLVTRNKCWRDYAAMPIPDDLRAWAIETLRAYIRDDDGHPALLDEEVQS